MGRLSAIGMLEQGSFDQALEWHLQYNHFPAISLAFIPIAKQAIDCGNDENWESRLHMPNGKILTAGEIVEGLHLDCFLSD